MPENNQYRDDRFDPFIEQGRRKRGWFRRSGSRRKIRDWFSGCYSNSAVVNVTQEEGCVHDPSDEAVSTVACPGSNTFVDSQDSDGSANQGDSEAMTTLPHNVAGRRLLVAMNRSEEEEKMPESLEMTPADHYNEMLETLIDTNFFGRYSVGHDDYFNILRRSVSSTSTEETTDTQ